MPSHPRLSGSPRRHTVFAAHAFPADQHSLFLSGLGYDTDTLTAAGRFTNGSALLLITSVLVFLIDLVVEQITQLPYASRPDS